MLIKVKFTRNGIPSGREYAYRSSIPVKIGDLVELPNGTGIVTAVNVPESEVEGFKDKVKEIGGLKINEHEKAKECMEFLRDYCKPDNCTMNCPFAYKDYTLHCNLGGSTQMYPCDWETEQKEWGKSDRWHRFFCMTTTKCISSMLWTTTLKHRLLMLPRLMVCTQE